MHTRDMAVCGDPYVVSVVGSGPLVSVQEMLNRISRCCTASPDAAPLQHSHLRVPGEQMPRQQRMLPARAGGASLSQELLAQKHTFLETAVFGS